MIEAIGELIFRIAAISIISSILRMALPESKAKKYVLFLTGLIVVLFVFTTILTLFSSTGKSYMVNEALFNLDNENGRVYSEQESQLIAACVGEELKREINTYIKANGLTLSISKIEVKLDRVNEQNIDLNSNLIHEIRIIIDSDSFIDNKELKYIQKHIAETHLISMSKICYYKEEKNE